MSGFKALRVDLSKRESGEFALDEEAIRGFLGGRGLGVRLLWDEVPPGADPLGPENALIFVTGPLQGTSAFFGSRCFVTGKSPLTGMLLSSNAGGRFAAGLKRCGYWALIVTGRADTPTFLQIRDHTVEFRDATPMWGMQTTDAQAFMREETGDREASTLVIGPAGERQVKIACIVTEGERRRTFARGGPGAVMGAKNLKGIVIRGTGEVEVADRAGLRKAQSTIAAAVRAHPEWARRRSLYGTLADVVTLNTLGLLPTRNWRTGVFEGADKLCSVNVRPQWIVADRTCGPYCPTPCSKVALVREGDYAGITTEGPEYECVYALGSNCGTDRFDAVAAAERLCDELGLDAMSAGCTVAFAMECFERGILTPAETDGLQLTFGNPAAIAEMIRKMAYRQGVGALFADGSRVASQRLGQGSDEFAMHAKGMEFGGYECRGSFGQALQFAISNRGGCHHDLGLPARVESLDGTGTQVEGKGDLVKRTGITRALFDSAIMCTFSRTVVEWEPIALAVSSVLGWKVTPDDLKLIGDRVLNLERAYNGREGARREDDRLPARLLKEPLPDGPHQGSVVPLERLKDDFYRAFGWDLKTGLPTRETLSRLGLDTLVLPGRERG